MWQVRPGAGRTNAKRACALLPCRAVCPSTRAQQSTIGGAVPYFINYNMKEGWYIDIAPIITANWEAGSGNVWTVPFGGGLGRLITIGFQPMSITTQFYGNAVHPSDLCLGKCGFKLPFYLFPNLTDKEKTLRMEEKLKEMEKEQHSK